MRCMPATLTADQDSTIFMMPDPRNKHAAFTAFSVDRASNRYHTEQQRRTFMLTTATQRCAHGQARLTYRW